jgi:hypothetical protein
MVTTSYGSRLNSPFALELGTIPQVRETGSLYCSGSPNTFMEMHPTLMLSSSLLSYTGT